MPSNDDRQIAALNSNVSQNNTRSSVQQSIFMLLYDLFISFPVRYTEKPGLMGAIALAI